MTNNTYFISIKNTKEYNKALKIMKKKFPNAKVTCMDGTKEYRSNQIWRVNRYGTAEDAIINGIVSDPWKKTYPDEVIHEIKLHSKIKLNKLK